LAIGGYLVFTPTPVRRVVSINPNPAPQGHKGDGDAEPSEVIEPLVVLNFGTPALEVRGEFGSELTVLPRVELEPGVQQPPRPVAARQPAPYGARLARSSQFTRR